MCLEDEINHAYKTKEEIFYNTAICESKISNLNIILNKTLNCEQKEIFSKYNLLLKDYKNYLVEEIIEFVVKYISNLKGLN